MGARPRLGDLLVSAGAISEDQLRKALEAQRQWGRPLGMTLVRLGFLEEETLVRVLAKQLQLPVAWLRGKRVSREMLDLVPMDLAEKHRCLPLLVNREGSAQRLFLAMEDPADGSVIEEIRARVGIEIRPVLVAPSELEEALHRHYHWIASGGEPDPMQADEGGEPEPQLAGPGSGESARGAAGPGELRAPVPPRLVLRALTELLLEKGVVEGGELEERLRRVAAAEEDAEL